MNDNLDQPEPPREVDFAGNTIWQCSTAELRPHRNLTHHVTKLSNGNYMMLRDVTIGRRPCRTIER